MDSTGVQLGSAVSQLLSSGRVAHAARDADQLSRGGFGWMVVKCVQCGRPTALLYINKKNSVPLINKLARWPALASIF